MKNETLYSYQQKPKPAKNMFSKNLKLFLPALILLLSNCSKEPLKPEVSDKTEPEQQKPMSTGKSNAILAMDAYNTAFFEDYGVYGNSRKAFYWIDQAKTVRCFFWNQAETIETLIDAYEINPTPAYKAKVQYLYNGFIDQNGTLWNTNQYNDDIIWGALMAVRAYGITNDATQLTVAKNNFDLVWNRGWDTNSLGGGIWWTTDNNTKNTCVNAPAAICAMRLFKATGDASYKDKAKLIMDWMMDKLFVISTGEVKGAILPNGYISEGALTYTQGTFIGAANELRSYYISTDYVAIAKKAMDYAKNNLSFSPGGYLQDEASNGDASGGKSIFARWASIFIKDNSLANTYGSWLDLNATQAWSIKNTNNLMWGIFGSQTPNAISDLNVNAWTANCGVSVMLNLYRFR